MHTPAPLDDAGSTVAIQQLPRTGTPTRSAPTSAHALWAQRVIRVFAASTNLLACGQSFVIAAPTSLAHAPHIRELVNTLGNFGAHPTVMSLPLTADVSDAAPLSDSSPLSDAVGDSTADLTTARATSTFDLPAAQALIYVSETPRDPGSVRLSGAASPVIVHAPLRGPITVTTGNGHPLRSPYEAPLPATGILDLATPASGNGTEADRAIPTTDALTYARDRIAWARAHMPITRAAVAGLAHNGRLQNRRIGLALVLEPKTAVLALELAGAGAQVSVFGHADETRDDIAAELRRHGIAVFADSSATSQQEELLAREFLAQKLEFLLDDGSHLIRMAHDPARAPGALDSLVGAAEETTSGLRPLRLMEAEGTLRIPVIASNDARSKTLFDNAYGTGQSCLLTILDLLDPTTQGYPLPGRHVVIAGYGDVGKGFARLSTALGAQVSVTERDPVRALQARMDGHPTGDLVDLAKNADLCVSATGVADTLSLEVLTALPDGAVVSVAGGVDQEIALDAALRAGAHWLPAPGMRAVERLHLPIGRELLVTDRGGCINCTAGEGNPIEIMDLSFAVQCAALHTLLDEAERRLAGLGALLTPGLHTLPASADDAVAAAALDCWLPLPSPSTSTSLSFLESRP